MGYNTDFYGQVNIKPLLSGETLDAFQRIVDASWDDRCPLKNPLPEYGCKWYAEETRKKNNHLMHVIYWDGGEKFYHAFEWMQYIVKFLAKRGHTCNGEFEARGEDHEDIWQIVVHDNDVVRLEGMVVYR